MSAWPGFEEVKRSASSLWSKLARGGKQKVAPLLVVVLVVAAVGLNTLRASHAASPYAGGEAEGGALAGSACTGSDASASGNSYVSFGGSACSTGTMVCNQTAQYLTSPWTYHALASGSQSYTVAQYEALPGYGTTLPPLPGYISGQSSSTEAAIIFAPGSTATLPAYDVPESPIVYYFEGGAYGDIGFQTVSGDQFLGGSASGFPEPTFNDGGAANGIIAQNDSHNLNANEAALATVQMSAAQGATTLTLSASRIPLVQYGQLAINGDTYVISAVSGSQSGYTLTFNNGLDAAVSAGTGIYYNGNSGGVTVSYLNIADDQHNTTGTITTGSGWTITHNDIHDGYSTPGNGVAIYGGDQGTIEYNCLSKMGDYGANIFGTNSKFDYNEVYESNYEPDPGCGCSGGGKWWATLNADIVGNAFVNDGPGGSSPAIWLDNGNTGTLISNNLFDESYASAVDDETGFNVDITNNVFENNGWGSGSGGCGNNCDGAISLNSSGGINIPDSRYENEILINSNQFTNNWEGIDIWQSGARSCENSGEGAPDANYCSGDIGYPIPATTGGAHYISHVGNSTNQTYTKVAQAAAAASSTVSVNSALAIDDQIGFSDPASTKTSSTTNVTSLNGSSTITASSTSGFPSSGQLRVGTSTAWGDGGLSYTGAILSYTGTTGTSFTGVSLVRGSGTLSGPVLQVQPYKITAQTCYTNDCTLTISPALASSEAAGTAVSNAGTCQLFATSAATPTSPLDPAGVSYWDACQWESKNISVANNTFTFDPTTIAASAPLTGGGTTTTCTAAHANSCGSNFMAFQTAGEAPFSTGIGLNAMMSNSSLSSCPSWDSGCTTSPLKNINSLSNPPGAAANNGEAAYNDVWSNNTYTGPWLWTTYDYGACGTLPSDPTTGKSMPSGACSVDFAQWQSDWQQDSSSTSN